jgi:Flp pilus assembly protein TadB
MLNQDDREQLAQIERRLMAEDPAFVARMCSPQWTGPSLLVMVMMVVLWAVTLVFGIVWGWPGVIVALLIVALAAMVRRLRRRSPEQRGPVSS